jgi:hypothetical protein
MNSTNTRTHLHHFEFKPRGLVLVNKAKLRELLIFSMLFNKSLHSSTPRELLCQSILFLLVRVVIVFIIDFFPG